MKKHLIHTLRLLCLQGLLALSFLSQAVAFATIRDAEIEETLDLYIRPILQSAGYPPEALRLIIVNDTSLNAFVANGSNMYIHTGLLIESERPEMIQGVMSHELGHITGGHLVRTRDGMEDATLLQTATTLLSIAAAAAGQGALAQGAMSASSTISQGNFYAFTRTQEQAADQAGFGFLDTANIPSQGMLDTLELLRSRERLAPEGLIPYLRSHPLTKDRIAHARNHTMENPRPLYGPQDPLVQRHARLQAKLRGFIEPPERTLNRYANDHSLAGEMAVAIALFKQAKLPEALTKMDVLIAQSPKDPYLHELKGQMLFEHGKIQPSIDAYQKANQLKPESALIALSYAQALLAAPKPDHQRALALLETVTTKESKNLFGWKLTAMAYSLADKPGNALLAQAEESYLMRDYSKAIRLSDDAQKTLPENSPAASRAIDLRVFATTALEKKKSGKEKPEQKNHSE